MEYVPLGSTGLKVSRLCLGCMSFGSTSWQPWVLDEQESMPFFKHAIEQGINFFDTADGYSAGVSEEITGRALKRYGDSDDIVLATKVFFPLQKGPNRGGLSRKNIIQSCENSLRRLGVETIDLYQIHRYDPSVPIEETLAALDLLVSQGKVRYIGASSMFAWQLARMLGTSDREGWARFISMQNHYNLIYREEEREMIPLCQEEGLGILPWSPLAGGLLARGQSVNDPRNTVRSEHDTLGRMWYTHPSDDHIIKALREVAESRGISPAQISMAWLLSKPGVTAPIVGASKLAHLQSAIDALDVTLSEEEIAKLEAPYEPHNIAGHSYTGPI